MDDRVIQVTVAKVIFLQPPMTMLRGCRRHNSVFFPTKILLEVQLSRPALVYGGPTGVFTNILITKKNPSKL